VYDNRVYPVFDDEGEVIQVAIYGRDITRIQESIQALIQSEKELEDTAHAMEEANAAVRVLLRRREEDRIEFEKRVIANVRTFIRPHLRDLRKTPVDDAQASLLDDIESGLQMIVSPFARDLSTGTFDLTPMEIRVARLIKEGKSNKEMAQRLGVSTNTILTHRFNLRTKLGIRGKKIDLKRHLLSLSAESPLSQGLF
jgi:DNA-binding CsgD family transcriptional regulator